MHSPPGRGRSEVFRGLAECQAVPSEGSTVLCATEARKGPVGGGGGLLFVIHFEARQFGTWEN